jgi:16S rRNA A1518/A1519 N6-dimethyltransferase RsmA/KsgA/DIM1 with predicted DNA glycosylase/AP lyase activity
MSIADKPWLIRELMEFPFLPTPLSVIEAALDLIHLEEDEVFADLGCGEAAVLIQVAKKCKGFCVGFEIDHRLLPEAKSKIKKAGLSRRVDVVYADLFTVDFSPFNVLYVYPFPPIAKRLSEKLREECRKDACVLAYRYPLPGLVPAETAAVSGSSIYVYRF